MLPLSNFPSTDPSLFLGYKSSLVHVELGIEPSSIPRSLFVIAVIVPEYTLFSYCFNNRPALVFFDRTKFVWNPC